MLVSEAIRATRQYLGQDEDTLNRLDGAVAGGAGTIDLEFASPVPRAGSVVEIRSATNSELVYVWSVASQTLTVSRGWDDSTAAAFADGDIVALDPVVSHADVFTEILNELRGLPSEGLGKLTSDSVTYSVSRQGFDTSGLTDPVIAPLALYQQIGGRDLWVYDFFEHPDFIRPRAYDTADGDVTLHYRTTFDLPTAHDDDLNQDCGVPESAQDIIAIGAAIRLVYSQEQLRGQAGVQLHARGSEDVPPGSGARSVSLLHQWKATRLAHEQRRTRERFPRRRL